MTTIKLGDRVLFGVAPGPTREYTVTAEHPIAMVQITRFDARLGRNVVIDVCRDELRPSVCERAAGTCSCTRTHLPAERLAQLRTAALPDQAGLAQVFARCQFCGDPVAGLLADCPKPDCLTRSLDMEMAFVRRDDR